MALNIQVASVAILCEPKIKPSLEIQAIARVHRMGQVRKVQVHRLILPENVGEQMLVILARKQSKFDSYARDRDLANSISGAKGTSAPTRPANTSALEKRSLIRTNVDTTHSKSSNQNSRPNFPRSLEKVSATRGANK